MLDLDDKSDNALPSLLGSFSIPLTATPSPEPAPNSGPPYAGACHCGSVRFRVTTPITTAGRCDCPHCQSRSIVLAQVDEQGFELLSDEASLALHPFHRRLARHYYCPTCGVYPFLKPREAGATVLVNVFCLDDFDPTSLSAPRR